MTWNPADRGGFEEQLAKHRENAARRIARRELKAAQTEAKAKAKIEAEAKAKAKIEAKAKEAEERRARRRLAATRKPHIRKIWFDSPRKIWRDPVPETRPVSACSVCGVVGLFGECEMCVSVFLRSRVHLLDRIPTVGTHDPIPYSHDLPQELTNALRLLDDESELKLDLADFLMPAFYG
jgi:hypothetical protein